jgi:mono/diheme cytochrome c family protein
MELMSGRGFVLLVAAITATACGGGPRAGGADTTAMSSTTTGDTAAAPTADTTAAAPAPAPATDSTAAAPGAGAATTNPSAAAPPSKSTTGATKPTSKPAPKPAGDSSAAGQDTGKAAAAGKSAAKPAAGAPTPQQVALGDSIFHGLAAGGTCTACHGQDAKGTAVAPNLTDSEWLNGDGSYQFIVTTVTNGVPKPKQHPAPMPPKGGAALSDDQVKAVAAYVYSLSHKT